MMDMPAYQVKFCSISHGLPSMAASSKQGVPGAAPKLCDSLHTRLLLGCRASTTTAHKMRCIICTHVYIIAAIVNMRRFEVHNHSQPIDENKIPQALYHASPLPQGERSLRRRVFVFLRVLG